MLLTNQEAAEFLNLSPNTLNNSRTTGILAGVKAPPHLKMGRKTIRYRKDSLETWIDQFEQHTSTSDEAA